MKKILIIDNTFDPPHGSPEIQDCLREAAKALGPIELVVARAPECKIPKDLKGFDGAVLSGSKTRINETAPWIDLEMQAIKKLYEHKIPTLGICYGEQLIAKTLAGESVVGVSKQFEHGWAELEQSGNFLLFEGLPKKFYSFQNHHDEVYSLPDKFRVSLSSEDCKVQAYEVIDAPIWCVQFHPERGFEAGNSALDKKLAENPKYRALNRDCAEKVYNPEVGKKIFFNFLKIVWAKSNENKSR